MWQRFIQNDNDKAAQIAALTEFSRLLADRDAFSNTAVLVSGLVKDSDNNKALSLDGALQRDPYYDTSSPKTTPPALTDVMGAHPLARVSMEAVIQAAVNAARDQAAAPAKDKAEQAARAALQEVFTKDNVANQKDLFNPEKFTFNQGLTANLQQKKASLGMKVDVKQGFASPKSSPSAQVPSQSSAVPGTQVLQISPASLKKMAPQKAAQAIALAEFSRLLSDRDELNTAVKASELLHVDSEHADQRKLLELREAYAAGSYGTHSPENPVVAVFGNGGLGKVSIEAAVEAAVDRAIANAEGAPAKQAAEQAARAVLHDVLSRGHLGNSPPGLFVGDADSADNFGFNPGLFTELQKKATQLGIKGDIKQSASAAPPSPTSPVRATPMSAAGSTTSSQPLPSSALAAPSASSSSSSHFPEGAENKLSRRVEKRRQFAANIETRVTGGSKPSSTTSLSSSSTEANAASTIPKEDKKEIQGELSTRAKRRALMQTRYEKHAPHTTSLSSSSTAASAASTTAPGTAEGDQQDMPDIDKPEEGLPKSDTTTNLLDVSASPPEVDIEEDVVRESTRSEKSWEAQLTAIKLALTTAQGELTKPGRHLSKHGEQQLEVVGYLLGKIRFWEDQQLSAGATISQTIANLQQALREEDSFKLKNGGQVTPLYVLNPELNPKNDQKSQFKSKSKLKGSASAEELAIVAPIISAITQGSATFEASAAAAGTKLAGSVAADFTASPPLVITSPIPKEKKQEVKDKNKKKKVVGFESMEDEGQKLLFPKDDKKFSPVRAEEIGIEKAFESFIDQNRLSEEGYRTGAIAGLTAMRAELLADIAYEERESKSSSDQSGRYLRDSANTDLLYLRVIEDDLVELGVELPDRRTDPNADRPKPSPVPKQQVSAYAAAVAHVAAESKFGPKELKGEQLTKYAQLQKEISHIDELIGRAQDVYQRLEKSHTSLGLLKYNSEAEKAEVEKAYAEINTKMAKQAEQISQLQEQRKSLTGELAKEAAKALKEKEELFMAESGEDVAKEEEKGVSSEATAQHSQSSSAASSVVDADAAGRINFGIGGFAGNFAAMHAALGASIVPPTSQAHLTQLEQEEAALKAELSGITEQENLLEELEHIEDQEESARLDEEIEQAELSYLDAEIAAEEQAQQQQASSSSSSTDSPMPLPSAAVSSSSTSAATFSASSSSQSSVAADSKQQLSGVQVDTGLNPATRPLQSSSEASSVVVAAIPSPTDSPMPLPSAAASASSPPSPSQAAIVAGTQPSATELKREQHAPEDEQVDTGLVAYASTAKIRTQIDELNDAVEKNRKLLAMHKPESKEHNTILADIHKQLAQIGQLSTGKGFLKGIGGGTTARDKEELKALFDQAMKSEEKNSDSQAKVAPKPQPYSPANQGGQASSDKWQKWKDSFISGGLSDLKAAGAGVRITAVGFAGFNVALAVALVTTNLTSGNEWYKGFEEIYTEGFDATKDVLIDNAEIIGYAALGAVGAYLLLRIIKATYDAYQDSEASIGLDKAKQSALVDQITAVAEEKGVPMFNSAEGVSDVDNELRIDDTERLGGPT